MDNCSENKKDIAGITDMKVLAEMIGDLHYETLSIFLEELCDKLILDSTKDRAGGRSELAKILHHAGSEIYFASITIEKAWEISKSFMKSGQAIDIKNVK